MNRLAITFVLGVLALQASACTCVAATGLAGRNEVEQDFAADLEPTWNTTIEALRSLGVESPTATLASTEGEIEFDDVVVRVERHPESFTRVIIRVGTFHTENDQRRAGIMMQKVQDLMGEKDEFLDWTKRVRALDEPSEKGALR